jgi:hypothetical protein
VSPGRNNLGVKPDYAANPQMRDSVRADKLVKAGAVDAEPVRDLTRVPKRLDDGRVV